MIPGINDWITDFNEDALTMDGFDEAIVGMVGRCGMESVVCYDYHKCIEILTKEMTEEEAIEYFDFNCLGTYMGENTPMILIRCD